MDRSGTKVLASWTLALLDALALDDAAQAQLFSELGMQIGDLRHADAKLSERVACAIWVRLVDGKPGGFGVRFAERLEPQHLGLVGYIAAASATVGDALERTVRFHRLVKSDGGAALSYRGEAVALIEHPASGVTWPRHFAEAVVASYLAIMRLLSGTRIQPLAVSFRHGRGEQDPFWGCEVTFGADEHSLVLPRSALGLPVKSSDPKLLGYLERLAFSALPNEPSWLLDLRRLIAADLPASGIPPLSSYARKLAMSARTLQRKLGRQGFSFRTLRDDVRRTRNAQLQKQQTLNGTERAFLLGFKDTGSLRRAERRWQASSAPAPNHWQR